MVNEESSGRTTAERVFHAYLERLRTEEDLELTGFIAAQSTTLTEEELRAVHALAADYELLRGRLRGDASGIVPGREVGDFRLQRRLGGGGAGSVWEAVQISLGRRVALKILHPHLTLTDRPVERFRREAETGGRLRHPAIAAVIAVGCADGLHFIAQELVGEGETLATHFARLRELSELPHDYYRVTAALFVELADALRVAHEAGVIHRDVKPANVLLTEDGRPKLADFGLAKLVDQLSISRTGELAGTPFYLSPEQATGRNREVDARSDVFSLGVTLYEALTLQRPFQGDSSQQVLRKIALDEPQDPRRLRSRVPRELALICLKAIEKASARRYGSMAEFAADLRRWLHDEPIQARAPLPHERAWKWALRHRVWSVTLGLGGAAFLVVGAMLVYTHSLRVRSERDNATLRRALEAAQEAIEFMDDPNGRAQGLDPPPFVDALVECARAVGGDDLVFLAGQQAMYGRKCLEYGHYREARTLLGEAAALYTEVLGPGEEPTLDARVDYAEVLEALFDRRGMVQELTSVLQEIEDAGPTDVRLAEVLVHLHASELRSGPGGRWQALEQRFGPLEERLRRTIEALADEAAPNPARFRLMGHLAWLCMRDKRFLEALAIIREARAGLEENLNPDHPWTLDALERELSIRGWLGQHVESRRLCDELARRVRRSVGRADPRIARVKSALGQILLDCGDRDEAVRCQEEALEELSLLFPPEHAAVLTTRTHYGIALGRAGRLEEAETVLRETIAAKEAQFPPYSPAVLLSLRALAEVVEWEGRPDEAVALFEDRLARNRRAPTPNPREEAISLGCLAMLRARQGRPAEARDLLLEVIALREREGHRFYFGDRLNLVEVLLDLGDLPAADSRLTAIAADQPEVVNSRRREEISLRVACLRARLLRLQGRFDEARAALDAIDPLAFQSYSAPGARILEAQRLVELAHVLLAQGDTPAAHSDLTTALASLEDVPWLGPVRDDARALLSAAVNPLRPPAPRGSPPPGRGGSAP